MHTKELFIPTCKSREIVQPDGVHDYARGATYSTDSAGMHAINGRKKQRGTSWNYENLRRNAFNFHACSCPSWTFLELVYANLGVREAGRIENRFDKSFAYLSRGYLL